MGGYAMERGGRNNIKIGGVVLLVIIIILIIVFI